MPTRLAELFRQFKAEMCNRILLIPAHRGSATDERGVYRKLSKNVPSVATFCSSAWIIVGIAQAHSRRRDPWALAECADIYKFARWEQICICMVSWPLPSRHIYIYTNGHDNNILSRRGIPPCHIREGRIVLGIASWLLSITTTIIYIYIYMYIYIYIVYLYIYIHIIHIYIYIYIYV